MNDTPKEASKATPASVIEMLVHCVNRNELGAFYQWAEKYRDALSLSGETRGRIARLLRDRPKSMTLLDTLQGKMKGLVSERAEEAENVFISAASQAFLGPLLSEWQHRHLYAYHNLGVRSRVLLHGPTGNGKSTIARYLARQMALPLVEVQADSIIDSGMGRSGRNISAIFENLKEPCILFWDEVDTIGRRRGGAGHDKGVEVENERMVNSILLNLDRLDPAVFFVGATNRRDVLDSAFVRRFDAQFEVGHPGPEEKQAFARQLVAFHQLPADFEPTGYEALASFSDVRQAVIASARRYIAQQVAGAA